MKFQLRFRHALYALPVLTFGAVIACTDPPAPALGHVWMETIRDTDPDGKQIASATYLRSDTNGTEGDISKGVTVADGLSVPIVFLRTVENPPDDKTKADALLNKAWKFNVTGDAFTVTASTKSADELVINSVHPGDGNLILTVDGLTGNATMTIHIADQNSIPPNTYINVVPEASTTPDEASTSTTDESDSGVDGGA
jgi:hypothetical protein